MMKVYTYNPATGKMEWNPNGANKVSFTPSGNIVATNVQDAIEELDSEKAGLASDNNFTGLSNFEQGITVGGYPILESGRNSQGTYLKYANGELLCYGRSGPLSATQQDGALYRSGGYTQGFPLAFDTTSGGPSVVLTGERGAASITASLTSQPNGSSFSYVIYSTGNSGDSAYTAWIARGRWRV